MSWESISEDILTLKTTNGKALSKAIRESAFEDVIDVVCTSGEIAIQHRSSDPSNLISVLNGVKPTANKSLPTIVEIPVCYDLGLDWDAVQSNTGLTKPEVIHLHLQPKYVSRLGFTPGFIYLDGLDPKLKCPRLENPRTHLHGGSVGIGGEMTGIYSLEGPGGWQIIGRTPFTLFDIHKPDPIQIPEEAVIQFRSISLEEFNDWPGNT